jgi:hypothetical protein
MFTCCWRFRRNTRLVRWPGISKAKARSAAGCTCYIFQNRESLIANVGNEYKVDSLLANLQTKIFCQNTGRSNDWASSLLGERWEQILSTGIGHSQYATEPSHASSNVNMNQQKRYFVEPAEFTVLRRGGSAGAYQVEIIVYFGGRVFSDGLPYQRIRIDQRTGHAAGRAPRFESASAAVGPLGRVRSTANIFARISKSGLLCSKDFQRFLWPTGYKGSKPKESLSKFMRLRGGLPGRRARPSR